MLTKVELLTKYKDQQPKMFEKCYPVSAVLDMLVEYRNQGIDEAVDIVSKDKLEFIDYYDFSKGVETIDNSERSEILSLKEPV